MIRLATGLSVALSLLGLGCIGPAPKSPGTPDGAGNSTFESSTSTHPVFHGCQFDSAKFILETFCLDCHSTEGHRGRTPERAQRVFQINSYSDWMGGSRAVPGRVNKDSLEDDVMPPPDSPSQPTDAQRRILIDWVRRGSPNTVPGR